MLFCTARVENTFGTVAMCNLSDSRMHYRRSCLQHFANPMFSRLAVLIIHRKIGQWLFLNGICFSQQPPEGGCQDFPRPSCLRRKFQLTAARRRLRDSGRPNHRHHCVSTHSRPKAAAYPCAHMRPKSIVSTHSRPKAATLPPTMKQRRNKCFNSQPPEGGCTTK